MNWILNKIIDGITSIAARLLIPRPKPIVVDVPHVSTPDAHPLPPQEPGPDSELDRD
jgi:hypothetical protein